MRCAGGCGPRAGAGPRAPRARAPGRGSRFHQGCCAPFRANRSPASLGAGERPPQGASRRFPDRTRHSGLRGGAARAPVRRASPTARPRARLPDSRLPDHGDETRPPGSETAVYAARSASSCGSRPMNARPRVPRRVLLTGAPSSSRRQVNSGRFPLAETVVTSSNTNPWRTAATVALRRGSLRGLSPARVSRRRSPRRR